MNRNDFITDKTISRDTVNRFPDKLFNSNVFCSDKKYVVNSLWQMSWPNLTKTMIKMKLIDGDTDSRDCVIFDTELSVVFQGLTYTISKISEERKGDRVLEIELEEVKDEKN